MATSGEIKICNTALSHIGISELITDFDQADVPARMCELHYADTRDELLADYPWWFAQVCVALAMTSDTVSLGYGYRYRYPTDCLKAQIVTDSGGSRWPGGLIASSMFPYGIAFGLAGRQTFQLQADPANPPYKLILTDIPEAYLWYTQRIENTDAFDPLFKQMLALALAVKLAGPLRVDAKTIDKVEVLHSGMRSRAEVLSASQGQRDSYMPESPSVLARLG